MKTRVLHLHIDRIVVDGLPASAQARFVRALETHLKELAGSQGSGALEMFASKPRWSLPVLNAGTLRQGATAEQAASQVATAVQQSIARGPEAQRNG